MSINIHGLHSVSYAVSDMAASEKLWKDLGFSLLHVVSENGAHSTSIFWIGKVQLHLDRTAATSRAAEWRASHKRDDMYEICLEVENLDDAISECRAKGIGFLSKGEPDLQGTKAVIDPQFTGDYFISLIELAPSLKGKTVNEQQDMLTSAIGSPLLSAEIGMNGIGFTNIHHIGINVEDYPRARRIWEDVLGIDALYQHFRERDFEEDAMYLGDTQVHLYRSDNPALKFYWWPRENGDGMATMSVAVDNINDAIAYLRSHGMDIAGKGPESMSQGMDVFIDKEYTGGNDFEIVEMHYFLKGKPVETQKKIVYHFFGEGTVL